MVQSRKLSKVNEREEREEEKDRAGTVDCERVVFAEKEGILGVT